ncbi:MAG: glycoside hydrolase family 3 N-terminal domain-containing protein [Patescibacteria group bacterium]
MRRWGYTPLLIISLVFLVVATWYNYQFKPLGQGDKVVTSSIDEVNREADSGPASAQTELDRAFSGLPDKQKVGLTLAFPLLVDDNLTVSSSAQEISVWSVMAQTQPGFISLFGQGISQEQMAIVKAQLDRIFAGQPWQPVLAVDHEGGLVQRLSGDGFASLESWYEVCHLPGEERSAIMSDTALQLIKVGIGVVYGPVVDLYQSGSSLGHRSCSADPAVVTTRALELMQAYLGQGVLPVIKHYPGLGQSSRDLHQSFEVVAGNEADLQPFLSILSQQPLSGVMVSHAGVKDLYLTPCSLTKKCVNALLEEFPKTLVFSDALDMQAVYANPELEIEKGDLLTASRLALEAGVDVLVFGQGVKPEQMHQLSLDLVELYQHDPNFKSLIDAHARKIWDYRQIYWQ